MTIGVPNIDVEYPDKDYEGVPLSEFRALMTALSLAEATEIRGAVPPVAFGEGLYIRFRVRNTTYEASTVLWVDGRPEVTVNGVVVAAKERIDALFDRKRHAEELAAEEEAEAEARATVGPPSAPEPRWKRVLNHPWTVQIGGGLVAGFVLFALGYIIGSN